MVGGGRRAEEEGVISIDTTEMLVHGGSSWTLAGALPNGGIKDLASVSLNNEIFVTGDMSILC